MNTLLQGDEQGLAGYWNFDDGTANDLSENGNHGTLRENAVIVTGKTARLLFSTIDWVNAGDKFALDLMIEGSADWLAGNSICIQSGRARSRFRHRRQLSFKGWWEHLL